MNLYNKLFIKTFIVLLALNSVSFASDQQEIPYYDYEVPLVHGSSKEEYVQSAIQKIDSLENLKNMERKDIKITLKGTSFHKYFFSVGEDHYAKYLENCTKEDVGGNLALHELDKNFKYREIMNFFEPYKNNFEFLFAKKIVKISEKEDYILIMDRALGENIEYLIERWCFPGFADILNRAFYFTGKAIGRLHSGLSGKPDLKKTLIHGDLHFGNVFFDSKSGKVSIIDFEHFGDSRCASYDMELFFEPFSIYGKYGRGLKTIHPALVKDMKGNFMVGYCSTLNGDKNEKIELLKLAMMNHPDFPPHEIEDLVHRYTSR